jgi:hypothetical protein
MTLTSPISSSPAQRYIRLDEHPKAGTNGTLPVQSRLRVRMNLLTIAEQVQKQLGTGDDEQPRF